MQRRFKIKLTKLLVLAGCWLVIGTLIPLYDYFLLSSDFSLGYAPGYSLGRSLFYNMTAALVGAAIGGTFFIFYINEKYHERSYGFTILASVLSFIITVGLIIVLLGLTSAVLVSGKSMTHPDTLRLAKSYILNTIHLKSVIVWAIVVGITQFVLSIDLKFGHGVLWKFIRGKYRHPREEKRVFMCLDINSSTSIAEKLGNEKYHRLLKDFFSDITNPILNNRGEIYQYVGDEVLVSWPYRYGVENSHCIQCYFDIKKGIEAEKQKYEQRYGLVPSFKAGIHFGTVMAGEVGVIKRDITFSGDVLNTTSRIQNLCKDMSVEMLLSEDLNHELPATSGYIARSMGPSRLRGKEKDIGLITMEPAATTN